MRVELIFAGATLLVCAPAAGAQTPARPWTLSLSADAGWSQESDLTTQSGYISLSRTLSNNHQLGLSIGTSETDAPIPEFVTLVDASTEQAQVWWSAPIGLYNIEVSAGFGRQSADARIESVDRGPEALRGLAALVTSETEQVSLSASLSRSFGETVVWTPSVSIGFDRAESTGEAVAANRPNVRAGLDAESEGAFAVAALDVSRQVSSRLLLSANAAFIATEELQARAFDTGPNSGWQRQSPSLEDGAAQFGQIGVSSTINLSEQTGLTFGLGSTLGLADEQYYGSASIAWSF